MRQSFQKRAKNAERRARGAVKGVQRLATRAPWSGAGDTQRSVAPTQELSTRVAFANNPVNKVSAETAAGFGTSDGAAGDIPKLTEDWSYFAHVSPPQFKAGIIGPKTERSSQGYHSDIDHGLFEVSLEDLQDKIDSTSGANFEFAALKCGWVQPDVSAPIKFVFSTKITSVGYNVGSAALVDHGMETTNTGYSQSRVVITAAHNVDKLLAVFGEPVLRDDALTGSGRYALSNIKYFRVRREGILQVRDALNSLFSENKDAKRAISALFTKFMPEVGNSSAIGNGTVEEPSVVYVPASYMGSWWENQGTGVTDRDVGISRKAGDMSLFVFDTPFQLAGGGSPAILSDSHSFPPIHYNDDGTEVDISAQDTVEIWFAGVGYDTAFDYKGSSSLKSAYSQLGELHAAPLHVSKSWFYDRASPAFEEDLARFTGDGITTIQDFDNAMVFMGNSRDATFLVESGEQQREGTNAGDSGGSAVLWVTSGGKRRPVSFAINSYGSIFKSELDSPSALTRVSAFRSFLQAVSDHTFDGVADQELALLSKKLPYVVHGVSDISTALTKYAIPFQRGTSISRVGETVVVPSLVNGSRSVRKGDVFSLEFHLAHDAGTSGRWGASSTKDKGFSARVSVSLHRADGTIFATGNDDSTMFTQYRDKPDQAIVDVLNGSMAPPKDTLQLPWSDTPDAQSLVGVGGLRMTDSYVLEPIEADGDAWMVASLTEWPLEGVSLVASHLVSGNNVTPTQYLYSGVNAWLADASATDSLRWAVGKNAIGASSTQTVTSGAMVAPDGSNAAGWHARIAFTKAVRTAEDVPRFVAVFNNASGDGKVEVTFELDGASLDQLVTQTGQKRYEFVVHFKGVTVDKDTSRLWCTGDADDALLAIHPVSGSNLASADGLVLSGVHMINDGRAVQVAVLAYTGTSSKSVVFAGSTMDSPPDSDKPQVISLTRENHADERDLRMVLSDDVEVSTLGTNKNIKSSNIRASSGAADAWAFRVIKSEDKEKVPRLVTQRYSPHTFALTRWTADFHAFVCVRFDEDPKTVLDKADRLISISLLSWPEDKTTKTEPTDSELYNKLEFKFGVAYEYDFNASIKARGVRKTSSTHGVEDEHVCDQNGMKASWDSGNRYFVLYAGGDGVDTFPMTQYQEMGLVPEGALAVPLVQVGKHWSVYNLFAVPAETPSDSATPATTGAPTRLIKSGDKLRAGVFNADRLSMLENVTLVSSGGTGSRPVRYIGADPLVNPNVSALAPRVHHPVRMVFQAPSDLHDADVLAASVSVEALPTDLGGTRHEFKSVESFIEFANNRLIVPETYIFWSNAGDADKSWLVDKFDGRGWPNTTTNGFPDYDWTPVWWADTFYPRRQAAGFKNPIFPDKKVPDSIEAFPAEFPSYAEGYSNLINDGSNVSLTDIPIWTGYQKEVNILGFNRGSRAIQFLENGVTVAELPSDQDVRMFSLCFDKQPHLARSTAMFPSGQYRAFWIADEVFHGTGTHTVRDLRLAIVRREGFVGSNSGKFVVEVGPRVRVRHNPGEGIQGMQITFDKITSPCDFVQVPSSLRTYAISGRPRMNGTEDVAFLGFDKDVEVAGKTVAADTLTMVNVMDTTQSELTGRIGTFLTNNDGGINGSSTVPTRNRNVGNVAMQIELLKEGKADGTSELAGSAIIADLVSKQSATVSNLVRSDDSTSKRATVSGKADQYRDFIQVRAYRKKDSTSTMLGVKDPVSAVQGKDISSLTTTTKTKDSFGSAVESLLDSVSSNQEGCIKGILELEGKDADQVPLDHVKATVEIPNVSTKGLRVYSVGDGTVTDITGGSDTTISYTGTTATVTTRFSTVAFIEDLSPEIVYTPAVTQPFLWHDTNTVISVKFLGPVEIPGVFTIYGHAGNNESGQLESYTVAKSATSPNTLIMTLRADTVASYNSTFTFTIPADTITVDGESVDEPITFDFTHKRSRDAPTDITFTGDPRIGVAVPWSVSIVNPQTGAPIGEFMQDDNKLLKELRKESSFTRIVDEPVYGGGVAAVTLDQSTGAGTITTAENTSTLRLGLAKGAISSSDGAHANIADVSVSKNILGVSGTRNPGAMALGSRTGGENSVSSSNSDGDKLVRAQINERSEQKGFSIGSMGTSSSMADLVVTATVRRKGVGSVLGHASSVYTGHSNRFSETTDVARTAMEEYGRVAEYDEVLEEIVVKQELVKDSKKPVSTEMAAIAYSKDGSRVYVAGGRNGTTDSNRNDVAYSEDGGRTWTRVRANGATAGFAKTRDAAMCVLSDDTLLYMGGNSGGSTASLSGKVWRSSDSGMTWTHIATLPVGFRGSRAVVSRDISNSATAINGKETVWIVGGLSTGDATNMMWYSTDAGYTWVQGESFPSSMGGRYHPGVVILPSSGDLLVFCGSENANNTSGFYSMWRFDGLSWFRDNDNVLGSSSSELLNECYLIHGTGDQSESLLAVTVSSSNKFRALTSKDNGMSWSGFAVRGGIVSASLIRSGFVAFSRLDGSVAVGMGLDGTGHLGWVSSEAPFDAWSTLGHIGYEDVYEVGIAPVVVDATATSGTTLTDVAAKDLNVTTTGPARIDYANAYKRARIMRTPVGTGTSTRISNFGDLPGYVDVRDSSSGKSMWDRDATLDSMYDTAHQLQAQPGHLSVNGDVLDIVFHPGAFEGKNGLRSIPTDFGPESANTVRFTYSDSDEAPYPTVSVSDGSTKVRAGNEVTFDVVFSKSVTDLATPGVELAYGEVTSVTNPTATTAQVVVRANSESSGTHLRFGIRAGAVTTTDGNDTPNVGSDPISVSIGDPYVTPIEGPRYKLPVESSTVRMLQTDGGVMVNATQRRMTQAQAFVTYGYQGNLAPFCGAEDVSFFRWVTVMHRSSSGSALLVDAETLVAFHLPDISSPESKMLLAAAARGENVPLLDRPTTILLRPGTQRTVVRGLIVARDADSIPGENKEYGLYASTVAQSLRIIFRDPALGRIDLKVTRYSDAPLVRNSIGLTVEHQHRVARCASGALVREAPVRDLRVRRPSDRRVVNDLRKGKNTKQKLAKNRNKRVLHDTITTQQGTLVGELSVAGAS